MFGAVENSSTPIEDETENPTPEVSSYKNSNESSPLLKRFAGDDTLFSSTNPPPTSNPINIGESLTSNVSSMSETNLVTPKVDAIDGATMSVNECLQDTPVVIDTSLAAETNVR